MLKITTLLLCLFLFTVARAETTTSMDNNFANNALVKIFIHQMVVKYHFNSSDLISLFSAVKIRPKITHAVKAPLEQKPWYIYKMLFVNEQRILQGVAFWNKYQDALSRAEQMYGVPASVIVATIGIETKYGQNIGDYPVIDALTNLAFGDTPRAPFFRKELEEFLLLTREQHLDPLKVTGSYAGAIGQPQFIPSSYRYYAVNFSGNDTIDLSHNEIDVIGSIANYYKKNGWQKNQPVAIPISNSGGQFQLSLNRPKSISLSELIEFGLITDDQLSTHQKLKLIMLQSDYGHEFWLGFHNFDVIKRYNHSELYAMAVYQLSYYITVMREKLK